MQENTDSPNYIVFTEDEFQQDPTHAWMRLYLLYRYTATITIHFHPDDIEHYVERNCYTIAEQPLTPTLKLLHIAPSTYFRSHMNLPKSATLKPPLYFMNDTLLERFFTYTIDLNTGQRNSLARIFILLYMRCHRWHPFPYHTTVKNIAAQVGCGTNDASKRIHWLMDHQLIERRGKFKFGAKEGNFTYQYFLPADAYVELFPSVFAESGLPDIDY